MQLAEESVFELRPGEPVRLRLLDQYLAEQQRLSAVERFAQRHGACELPDESTYRDLIPLTAPRTGEQYAFHVDLDVCTGCKACVAACHSLNGLAHDETWRSVGLLHGGSAQAPVQQTVTTACHHCIDPACLSGCPVRAYDKDPLTGIVRHLDDQCIGCQYCVFTCPYEVPQFNAKLGIVRKCDMCADRLAQHEAPACVQSCPNQAISIRVIEKQQALEDAQANQFLPGAPSPGITVPTTTYATERPLPRNLLPADFYALRINHEHRPLVMMLVLTQLSVGAFLANSLLQSQLGQSAHATPYHALLALATGLFALAASVLHLGRPQYAFRAVLGVKTSWLSREILAFGLFAGLAVLYAGALWHAQVASLVPLPAALVGLARDFSGALGFLVGASGALGVLCSVMVYQATRRPFWNGPSTAFKFFGCAALLGAASALVSVLATRLTSPDDPAYARATVLATVAVLALTSLKLLGEASIFRHLYDKQQTDLKRTALLMKGDLKRMTTIRFWLGGLGGVALPLALLLGDWDFARAWPLACAGVGLLLVLFGELFERRLFFSAMNSARMPGALR